MTDAIPAELKTFNAWITWRAVPVPGAPKPTKKPFYPVSGRLMDPTNSGLWVTYEYAVAMAARYDGLGFCLSLADPYTVIDLDDPFHDSQGNRLPDAETAEIIKQHDECVRRFNSYTEYSPSGTGVHIWVRGKIPAGKRRNKIEMYSADRYMTVTGKPYINAPIREAQAELDELYERMGGGSPVTLSYDASGGPEHEHDRTIYDRAMAAENGATFKGLWEGDLTGYPSQSEADQALTNILQFYTKSRAQIKRMFLLSALGQREKAKRRDYIDRNITKAFDNEIPRINFDSFANDFSASLAAKREKIAAANQAVQTTTAAPEQTDDAAVSSVYGVPPNLLGEIAQFIYAAAPRAVAEIALTGALGFMAGLTGRAYNVSGSGLNQYLLLLAPSGVGKDAISSGLGALVNAMTINGLHDAEKIIGPSILPSGQGLLRHLSKKSGCCVSVIGEFGVRMQRMMARNAPQSEMSLKQLLLDIYGKSGRTGVLGAASYADTEKSLDPLRRAAFTMIGESTPSEFYVSIDEQSFASGLVPRFTVIEVPAYRPPFNENHRDAKVPPELVKTLSAIGQYTFQLINNSHMHGKDCVDIDLEPGAADILRRFRVYTDKNWHAAGADNNAGHEAWSRTYLKALKLAALASFRHDNWRTPTITIEAAEWATRLIDYETNRMIETITAGKLGQALTFDSQQQEAMRSFVRKFLQPDTNVGVYDNYRASGCVTKAWLTQRCANLSCFKNDRMGSTAAINRAIRELIEAGDMRAVSGTQAEKQFGSNAFCYAVNMSTII